MESKLRSIDGYIGVCIVLCQVASWALGGEPGNWEDFSAWSSCSAQCGGGGQQVRSRLCNLASTFGEQVCPRPGLPEVQTQECNIASCTGEKLDSVISHGCWIVPPDAPLHAHADQNPVTCAQHCQAVSLEYIYSAMDLTVTSGKPGTCYCLTNYTAMGRSNRCDSICYQDSEKGIPFLGYGCGSASTTRHANVYQLRSLTPSVSVWGDWSTCSCDTRTRTRSRTCFSGINDPGPGECSVPLVNTSACQPNDVGEWTTWASWSSCSATCGGGGMMSRSRVCQPPCNGEVSQTCDRAGTTQWEDIPCGFAPCQVYMDSDVQPAKENFLSPIAPVGCYYYRYKPNRRGLLGSDNNPGFCASLCYPLPYDYGYFIMDMSGASTKPVNDWGWCTCVDDLNKDLYEQYGIDDNMRCNVWCGGKVEQYAPYLCGSSVAFVGTLYYKRGAMDITGGAWSPWSSCVCPQGQFRRRRCISKLYLPSSACPQVINEQYQVCNECRKCFAINEIKNGVVGGDTGNGYGDKRRFRCNDGYNISGQPVLTCTMDGNWDADPPLCKPALGTTL